MQALTFLLHPIHKVNRAVQLAYLLIRPTWIQIGHGGVDPIFQRAHDSLVQQEIDKNMSIIEGLIDSRNFADRIMNNLILLTHVRTRRLVRFSQYHAQELNKGHVRSLRKIYKHIDMVQSLRSQASILNFSEKNDWRNQGQKSKNGKSLPTLKTAA
jgi:hypothetical protein